MACLRNTSILGRLANTTDAGYPVAARALLELRRRGETLYLTPQNLVEFWAVATRPVAANGLGLSAAEADRQVTDFETTFPLLDDTPAVYPAWRTLVVAAGVSGKRVHDARLVAVCHVYGVRHILTFNVRHFAGLARFGPGVAVLDPATV